MSQRKLVLISAGILFVLILLCIVPFVLPSKKPVVEEDSLETFKPNMQSVEGVVSSLVEDGYILDSGEMIALTEFTKYEDNYKKRDITEGKYVVAEIPKGSDTKGWVECLLVSEISDFEYDTCFVDLCVSDNLYKMTLFTEGKEVKTFLVNTENTSRLGDISIKENVLVNIGYRPDKGLSEDNVLYADYIEVLSVE